VAPPLSALSCELEAVVAMAFGEIDLGRLKKVGGGLCERGKRPEMHDQPSLGYRAEGHDVTLFKRRPHWDGSPGHTESGVEGQVRAGCR